MKCFACANPQIVHIKYSSASICVNQFDSAWQLKKWTELKLASCPELELTMGSPSSSWLWDLGRVDPLILHFDSSVTGWTTQLLDWFTIKYYGFCPNRYRNTIVPNTSCVVYFRQHGRMPDEHENVVHCARVRNSVSRILIAFLYAWKWILLRFYAQVIAYVRSTQPYLGHCMMKSVRGKMSENCKRIQK